MMIQRSSLATKAFIGLALLSACGGRQGDSGVPEVGQQLDIPLSGSGWRYLWNPVAESIEDWKAIRGVHDMILGPRSTLIIADTDNARVVWFSRTGELVEVIGRRGDGPGEFQGPRDLVWDTDNGLLWVVDRTTNSVSRFRLMADAARFLDRFQVPERLLFSGGSGLVVENSESLWLVPGSHIGEKRIRLFNVNGEKIREFGDTWEPEVVKQRPGLSSMYNDTILKPVNNKRLAAVLTVRLMLEVWRLDGQLLDSAEIQLPEFTWIRSQDYPEGAVITFIQGVAADSASNSLFILTRGEKRLVLRELQIETLKLGASYNWSLTEPAWLKYPVVLNTPDGLLLYAVDFSNSGVVEFKGTLEDLGK